MRSKDIGKDIGGHWPSSVISQNYQVALDVFKIYQ